MSTSKRTGHFVASTHWDREWYQSFQDYRFRLVAMVDELLDTMKRDPEFRYFQMDGQAIPLEDYLEVRPEREPEVRALAEAGRLKFGPWYVLPDEFLVSGESLVRNLQTGLTLAGCYGAGGASRVGFICDLFGQTSQLPQILRGFSIDSAFLWRGSTESTHGALFRWRAPDGSEVIAYRFSPKGGYCSWAFKVRKGMLQGEAVELENAVRDAMEVIEFEKQRCPTPSFLVFDGGDHLEIEPQTSEILRRVQQQLKETELVHSHLDGFIEDLREQRESIAKTFTGELREPGELGDDAWVIPGVLSSRIHLKQANARCENELCLWAEPFSVFAARLGVPYPKRYLELAWKYLLQNHPHDSICGCSIDSVHKDMEYRFAQSQQIAAHVTQDALQAIAERVQIPELGERDSAVVVFNANADAVNRPVDLTLSFPADIDTTYGEFFNFEKKIGFRLFGPDGKELPYQYVAQRNERRGFRRWLRRFPLDVARTEVDITVPLQVPAYGYTTVICRPVKEPTRHLDSMQVDDHTIENECLQVAVNCNGTLRVTDKRNKQIYDGLLLLEDRADIGDGWYHGVAVNDQIHSSVASPAEVALVADGIGKATLSVRVRMELPRAFAFDRMTRSGETVTLLVTHLVTLRRGRPVVEVHTTVENNLRDHRLRVLLPTKVTADTYMADQAFDVVERPIALRADNARYKELEVETRPQQSWTAVFEKGRGLAVVSTGLPESAVRDLPDRPIALTLLRSFLKAVFTSGNEGGEIQGRREFDYLIVPLDGAPDAAALCRLGQELAAPPRAVEIDEIPAARLDRASRKVDPSEPMTQSFLRLESKNTVVTAIHRHTEQEAATVRMFNPTGRDLAADVELSGVSGGARKTDLEGRPGETLPKQGNAVRVALKPKQIVTVQWTG